MTSKDHQRSGRRRLFDQVRKTPTCWLWTGRVVGRPPNDLYGQMRWYGRETLAHRISYTLAKGPIPPGKLVLHTCDTPRCVRPSHLFLGTHQDNVDDMMAKGRHVNLPGEKHGMAKVTEKIVRSIRRSPLPLRPLAKKYKVSVSLVSQIRSGAIWKHVKTTRRYPTPTGERHENSKLTNAKVRKILRSVLPGKTLAAQLHVSPSLVSMVRTRKIWSHVKT